MSENVQITPGSGVTIGADSVVDVTLGSAQIQYIKIMDGTIGGTNKVAVTSNGLAIDGSGVTQPISAISLPLPTGASTSANQTTEISYLSTIATNTTNAGTPTVSGTVTVLQPTAANLNATVSQTIAGNLITESWINDGSGNAISSTSGSLDVFVSNFPATQPISGSVSILGTVAVTGTFWQTTQPVSGSGDFTVVQPIGSDLHTVVDSGSITVVPPVLPISAGFGQATIGTTGTAVQLSSNSLVNGVVISANISNVSPIVIGLSSVTNVIDGSGNGYVLAPGASIGIAVSNTNSLWVNGTANDVVSFVGS